MSRRSIFATRGCLAAGLTVGLCGALAGTTARADDAAPVDSAPMAAEAVQPVLRVPSPARIAARAAARHARRAPQTDVTIGQITALGDTGSPSAAPAPASQAPAATVAPGSAAPVTASTAPRVDSRDDSAWAVVQTRAAEIAARRTRPSKRLQAVLDSKGENEPSADGWWQSTLSTVASWWPSGTNIATHVARLTGKSETLPAAPPRRSSPLAHRAASVPLVAAHTPAMVRRPGPDTHIVAANVSAPSLMPPAAAPVPSHTTRQLARAAATRAAAPVAPAAAAGHAAKPSTPAPVAAAPAGPAAPKALAPAPVAAALGKRQIPAGAVVATTTAPLRAPLTTREWQQRTGTTRDPFVSLVAGTFEGEESTPVFDVGELRLVGVLWGQTDRFALVENVSGKGTALRPGDRLVNGYVESITPTSLTLVETGLRGSRKIILHMKEDDNGTRTQ